MSTSRALLDRPLHGHVEPLGAVGTDVYVVTRLVPSGPRGLWSSLAAAAGSLTSHDETSGEGHQGAHLAYLASLG